MILSDLIAALKSKGQTLLDRLTELYRIHGVHMTRQKSLTLTGSAGRAQIEYVMNTLRSEQPRQFSNLNVVSCIDYQTRSMIIGETPSPLTTSLPVSNVLEYALDEGSRILVRPSGTEPKIKFYFESVVPMSESENLSTAEANAQAQLKVVEDSLFQYIDSLNAQRWRFVMVDFLPFQGWKPPSGGLETVACRLMMLSIRRKQKRVLSLIRKVSCV